MAENLNGNAHLKSQESQFSQIEAEVGNMKLRLDVAEISIQV